MPALYYRLIKTDARTRTLANPSIRITDGIMASANESARHVALSVVWALEAIVFIVLGFIGRSKAFRVLGAGLFALVVLKILVIDLNSLETIYRTVVTMIVGVIALGAAFAYVKNKERIQQFLK